MVDNALHRKKVEWESKNPVLPDGVYGVEEDTGKAKQGDGIRRWLVLPYLNIEPYSLPMPPFSMTEVDALKPHFLPLWQADEELSVGQYRISPEGQIIRRDVAGITRGIYDPTEAESWTVVSGGGGGGGANGYTLVNNDDGTFVITGAPVVDNDDGTFVIIA